MTALHGLGGVSGAVIVSDCIKMMNNFLTRGGVIVKKSMVKCNNEIEEKASVVGVARMSKPTLPEWATLPTPVRLVYSYLTRPLRLLYCELCSLKKFNRKDIIDEKKLNNSYII